MSDANASANNASGAVTPPQTKRLSGPLGAEAAMMLEMATADQKPVSTPHATAAPIYTASGPSRSNSSTNLFTNSPTTAMATRHLDLKAENPYTFASTAASTAAAAVRAGSTSNTASSSSVAVRDQAVSTAVSLQAKAVAKATIPPPPPLVSSQSKRVMSSFTAKAEAETAAMTITDFRSADTILGGLSSTGVKSLSSQQVDDLLKARAKMFRMTGRTVQ